MRPVSELFSTMVLAALPVNFIIIPLRSNVTDELSQDPADLERAHIVVTSYPVITSEYGVFAPAKDESKGKGKKTVEENDSDEDSDDFTKRLKSAPKRGKQKDALFRVKWWRVVDSCEC